MSTTLAIADDQGDWTHAQAVALQSLGLDNPTPPEMQMFLHVCQRTGLDPFARQIYMVRRDGRQVIQTGIDGLRLIARRAVDAAGEALGYEPTQWCGRDGVWHDVWLDEEPPAAARVVVRRAGQPFDAVALFDAYAGRKRDGSLNRMWQTQGALMIAKCAEALALRKAFPQDLSGLYTSDEMHQADNPAPTSSSSPAGPAEEAAPVVHMSAAEVQEYLDQVAEATTREELAALWEAGRDANAPEAVAHAINQRAAQITATEAAGAGGQQA